MRPPLPRTPGSGLRPLVEAEIAARDESNHRVGLKGAGFPVFNTLEEFKVALSSVPQATFDYLRSLESIRAIENISGRRSPPLAPSPWAVGSRAS